MKPVKEDALLLIVDDDLETCTFLRKVISTWGMKAESITNPLEVLYHVRESFYNLVLLDAIMPGTSGIDLVPEIVDICPATKIIITTDDTEKQIAIQALSLGAFDFLEKPITPELLSHSVNRALETQKTELEYKKKDEDLKHSRDELLDHKLNLEKLNRQLMETNKALSVLAQNIERTRQETEKEIVLKIRALICPIIEDFQQDQNLADYHSKLTMLSAFVEDLTSGLGTETKITSNLTSTELRISSLIKNGLSTETIATHLFITPDTVKTHRKNIRKKLHINNSQHNLRNYLRLKLGEGVSQILPGA